MPTADRWKLIQCYVAGRCSAAEQRRLERWMEEDPANEKLIEELEQIWSLTPEEDFEVSVRGAWDRFRMREMRGTLPAGKIGRVSTPSDNRRMLMIFRAAAAMLLIIFAGYFSWQYLGEQGLEEKEAYQEQMQHITTQKGEKARISFSDGTVVTLNVASSLRYPKRFIGSKREVYLTGEAYFDVAPNGAKPFVVHTRTADVEVLGTKFNIRAWEEDTAVNIGVREGQVVVSSTDSSRQGDDNRILLAKGQYASVIEGKGISGIRNVDIDKYLLWLNGGIYFDNVPFKQVFLQIERKFDVQIIIKGGKDILEVPFTSTFRDRKLTKILMVLSASMKMEYRQEGNNIEFYKP